MNAAAVRLELCFAGTSRTDTATESRHFHTASSESREKVIQLREFHLQLSLARARPPGKNVEYQLRPIQNFAIQSAFEIALLRGSEVGIEEHHIRPISRDAGLQLFHLSRANQRGRVRTRAGLEDYVFHRSARAF